MNWNCCAVSKPFTNVSMKEFNNISRKCMCVCYVCVFFDIAEIKVKL